MKNTQFIQSVEKTQEALLATQVEKGIAGIKRFRQNAVDFKERYRANIRAEIAQPSKSKNKP